MKVLITLFALFFSGLALAKPLNNIVVFGDSLSDNGNLYEYMGHKIPISPPYFAGRFSNGPVWVEHLTASYFPTNANAHLLDYAFGGAGVSDEHEQDDVLFTLRREIDIYLSAHQGKAGSNSLFIVWIGSNNYIGSPIDAEGTLAMVNAGISRGLQRLVKAGAKHILVVNTPDLGQTPLATDFEAKETLAYFSRRHNELLLNMVNEMQQKYPKVQWLHFDVGSRFQELIDRPEDYGFKNIIDTCYDAKIDKHTHASVLHIAASLKLKAEDDICEEYLFFDPVHPTAPVHKIMAEKARILLDEAGVEFKSQ